MFCLIHISFQNYYWHWNITSLYVFFYALLLWTKITYNSVKSMYQMIIIKRHHFFAYFQLKVDFKTLQQEHNSKIWGNRYNNYSFFSEDPERKLLETPLHGVSGSSHISSGSGGGGRQSDSGSFTEDLQKTAAAGHNSRCVFAN